MGIDPSRGFVAFPRGLTDWEWYSEPNTARLFFHLLLTANWQEKQWQGISIRPGQLVTSQSQLAKQLDLSVRNIRTSLEHLQATGYLTVKTGSKYSIVCDPVAGLVEVPCIKRNGACALQALLAAELALAGISSFINADEAIDAMKSVGDALPCALKETAGGGMAATPSAIEWAAKYFARK